MPKKLKKNQREQQGWGHQDEKSSQRREAIKQAVYPSNHDLAVFVLISGSNVRIAEQWGEPEYEFYESRP